MHAEKCPVCEGTGKYEDRQCHGCDGKGWVQILDSDCAPLPYQLYIRPCYQPYSPNYDPYPGNVWGDDSGTYTTPPAGNIS